jgi:hypothetical protein
MKKLLGLILAATIAFYTVAPVEANDKAKKKPPVIAPSYALEVIDAEMWGILDINNRGDVLIERQLAEFASPAPLIINKNDKETAPFECPGTINETFGAGINNHRDIVGACNGRSPIGFVANPQSGSFTLLAVPGALTTWGTGINDLGQVVGFYANPVEPPFCCFLPPRHLHSFFWDRATGEYRTIDNPLAELVGGWTRLTGINNKGQIVGHYNTLRNVPSEEFQFIYDNGTFTPVEFPGADQTHIEGFNNNSQILGWYSDSACGSRCIFLFDSGEYFTISLPLPPNAPRPDGAPAGTASLSNIGGLNDKGQFVGAYVRISEWAIDMFGNLGPSRIEVGNFIATPQKPRKK